MDKIPDAVIEAMAREMWENSGRQMVADGLDPSLLQSWDEENEPHRENWRSNARTPLKAAEAAGYVLVPVEPTEAMQDDGNEEAESFIYSDEAGGKAWNDDGALNFWNAMLAARPKLSL